jgi:ATP-dependent exoDNAse (exonuclease V) beta subunit
MTIFHQLNDDAVLKEFTEDGMKRAKHLYQAISEAVFNEGRFSFVERFLYALNQLNPEQEMNQQQRDIRSQFLSLLNECENNENLNIDTLELMLQDLYAPSKPASVKLMTIHQAKGLEFDIVILPGLGKTGKSNPLSLIQIQEFSNHNILLAPIKSAYDREESKTYLYLKYIEKQQSHFEMMRLLYVAMSRAKEKLYLLGSVNKSGKVSSNTLLYFLSHFYQESIDSLENFPEENIKQLDVPKMIRYTELPTLSERETQHINEPKNLSRNIDLIYQSALGTIVHYFLEHSLFEP